MIIEEKMRILAKFFANTRIEGDPYLDRLFSLQNYWDEVYNENRIICNYDYEGLVLLGAYDNETGEEIDFKKHHFKLEVKAPTYHLMEINDDKPVLMRFLLDL